MIQRLRIQNFAIIDESIIEFGTGLNIVSGETGAGKSILMDALVLILGGRASSELIRQGCEEASVEACFDIAANKGLRNLLTENGIEVDDSLIIKRIVHRSGKNRIFINGGMATISTLQTVTSGLVDLCSQHEQQLISKMDEQLSWIDRFGGLEDVRAAVKSNYSSWKDILVKKLELEASDSARAQKIDFLRFQIQEIDECSIASDTEDSDLEAELKILKSAEILYSFCQEVEALIEGDNEVVAGLESKIASLWQKSRALELTDPSLKESSDILQNVKIHLEELNYFFRTYGQKVNRDEGKIESFNSRLAHLNKLKKKYGPTLLDVKKHLQTSIRQLSELENHAHSLEEVMSQEASLHENYLVSASALTEGRKKAAKNFSRSVEVELAELNMDRAKFSVVFTETKQPTASGLDAIQFEIAANPGEPLGALNKVASGGELSRIMLAMHNVVSSKGNIGVYLFDEVDTGIGGKTAAVVGAKLKKVAKNNQVICITHLPQVAAFANIHLNVEKRVKKENGKERTIASISKLDTKNRELELARMLGGIGNQSAALANARAMIANASAGEKNTTPPLKSIRRQKSHITREKNSC